MYTVEDLLSDQSFIDYCQNEHSVYKKQWTEMISVNPEMAKVVEEAKAMLSILSPVLPDNEIAAEVNKLREVLSVGEEILPATSNRRIRKILAYSFSLLLLISVSVYFLIPKVPSPALASKFETRIGERKQYILPDGSTVILNSNSSFLFNGDFGREDREIELTGNAFFKVAKDPSKPFIVKSHGFSTTAIGTAFYVHAGATAADYSVDLLEGKVKLEKNTSGEALYLTAGQKASWIKTNSTFTKQQYDTLSLNKWVKGILSFNNIPVKEVFKELEDWYSVDIEDKREHREEISINGDYVNAPLEDVLKIICFSLYCTYQIEGNKIIIQ